MKPRYIKFHDQNIFFQKNFQWTWSITHLRRSEGSTDGRLLCENLASISLVLFQHIKTSVMPASQTTQDCLEWQHLNLLKKILMVVHFDSHIAQGRTVMYCVIDILSHAYSHCHLFANVRLTFHICSKWDNTMCCFYDEVYFYKFLHYSDSLIKVKFSISSMFIIRLKLQEQQLCKRGEKYSYCEQD